MTTAVRAVAEARRLASIIRREPAGWRSYVNVQDWAPNAPTYSWAVAGPVDHCGLSMNSTEHNIGLRMGVHFPNAAWTPSGLGWFRERGLVVPFDEVAPGDHVYFRNAGSIYSATHVGMATSHWLGGGFNTIEYNTDISGQGREYWREPGYAVAVCRPLYEVEESQPEPVVEPARAWAVVEEDDVTELINVHADGNPDEHVAFWFLAGGVPSRVLTDGVQGPPDRNVSVSEWEAWLQSMATARDLVRDVAWVGPAQRRPVWRPRPPG